MNKPELARKTEILASRPELTPFIDDLPYEMASRAFHNVSFSPEQRGLEIQVEYASRITGQKTRVLAEIEKAQARGAIVGADWETQLDAWFDGYRQRMTSLYKGYLATMMTCASPMITGPARYPVERQRKRNQSADSKYENITVYAVHSADRFLKRLMPFGNGTAITSHAPNAVEQLKAKLHECEQSQEMMKAANKIVCAVFKNGSEAGVTDATRSSCAAKLMPVLNISMLEALQMLKPTDYSRKVHAFWPYQLSNNNQEIRRIQQRIKDVETLQMTIPDIAQTLPNGIEVRKSEDGKIEIHFGFKPDQETRAYLTLKSFKFSRYRNNAWVRRISTNAIAVFKRDIKPMLEKLPINGRI